MNVAAREALETEARFERVISRVLIGAGLAFIALALLLAVRAVVVAYGGTA
jgi:hypothetical protein